MPQPPGPAGAAAHQPTGFRVVDLTGGTFFVVMLRESGDDPWAALDHLSQERLSTAIVNVAHVMRLTLEYVLERKAFGRPIGSFQNSRFVLAEADAELDMARVYVDRCVEAHVAAELTSMIEAAKAKLISSEIQN